MRFPGRLPRAGCCKRAPRAPSHARSGRERLCGAPIPPRVAAANALCDRSRKGSEREHVPRRLAGQTGTPLRASPAPPSQRYIRECVPRCAAYIHWQQPGTRPAALPLPAQLLRARLFCPPPHEANHRKCTPNVTNHEGSDSKCVPVWLPREVTVFNAPSIAHAAAAQVPVTASPTAFYIDACEGPSPGFSFTTHSLLFLLGVRLRATRVSTSMLCCADWLAGRHKSNRS